MFILNSDNHELTPMAEAPYETEDVLQELLERHPKLLPEDLLNGLTPRRWLLLRREAGIAFEGLGGDRWSIDHLFVDQDGIPTLVEVKRASDTRARREVVAQMLDYASSIKLMGVKEVRRRFEELDASNALLQELIAGESEPDVDAFWSKVESNLLSGKIRLIFLADAISNELKRIILFLAEQFQHAEFFGVEIKRFISKDGVTTLIPTLFANPEVATAKASATRPPFTREEYVDRLQSRNTTAAASGVMRLMNWCTDNGGHVTFGNSELYPSCFLNWRMANGKNIWPFAIYAGTTVEVAFQWLQYRPPFDSKTLRVALQQRFNAIQEINLPDDKTSMRPSFPVTLLENTHTQDAIIEVLEWFVSQLRTPPS